MRPGTAAGIGPADDEAFGPHVLRRTLGTDRRRTLPSEADGTRVLEALTIDR
ncbi:hypothetical protein [Nocardiopsis dassonvillei]|uniref:hypothetical protein n=1 Tax=Nocardiopsis dassonvillei TaxID=2014 RepID=UPI003F576B29